MLTGAPVRPAISDRSLLPQVLLLEPDHVLRRTLALTARASRLAQVHETGSNERVAALLATQRFDAVMIALNEVHDGLQWIETIRAGHSRSDSDVPIIVLTDRIDHALAQRLRTHRVRRILLKPCTVRTLVDALCVYAMR